MTWTIVSVMPHWSTSRGILYYLNEDWFTQRTEDLTIPSPYACWVRSKAEAVIFDTEEDAVVAFLKVEERLTKSSHPVEIRRMDRCH